MSGNLRVVKLGGSLLANAECAQRLNEWLSLQPAMQTILIVGGGESVKRLRIQQMELELDDEEAHFAAIDRMVENSTKLMKNFPNSRMLSDLASIKSSVKLTQRDPVLYFFDCRAWCRSNCELPRNWTTTSDSIAAAICCELGASELVLLKSILPAFANLVEIAGSQIVDAEFRNWIFRLRRLKIVNLTNRLFPEVVTTQDAGCQLR